MARICSFCKREVNNDVCCDYCGTPLIFSEENKDADLNKQQNKSVSAGKKASEAETQREDNRREIKSGIEALYEQSKYIREEKNDSIFASEHEKNADGTDDIKINIYNSEFSDDNGFSDGETKVISSSDIEKIKQMVAEKNASGKKANNLYGNEPCKSEEISNTDADENISEPEAPAAYEKNGESENNEETSIAADNSYESNEEAVAAPSYERYMQMAQSEPDVRKEDTKLTKFLKWVLGIMFLAGLVCLFFPALNPSETSDTLSFSIIDAVLLVTTFAGMCFAFFEKKGIRKFIYGIMFSVVFFAVYIIFARPVPPKTAKELFTLLYLAVMLVVSLAGHISSGGTRLEKMQVWFDTFSYLALVADIFAASLAVMLWVFMPADMSAAMRPYLISTGAICIVALLGIILMMKRKISGANIYLLSAIATIVVSMLAYNRVINTIGYYSSVISLMNVIGSGYAKFIALCVIYPIFMYSALSFLLGKSAKEK